MTSDRLGAEDLAAVAALMVTGLLLAWPVLAGGHLTYVDNAVHLAEIAELARHDPGWSEIGFTGFPLGTLHSPLWYPLLARLARLGVPIEPTYRLALLAGFTAPALAVFGVARARTRPFPAFLAAYLVLVQAPSIFGVGSALAGMWTHGLGAAGVVVLLHLLSKPELRRGEHLAAATVLALVALTHLFALLAAIVVFVVTSIIHATRGVPPRETLRRVLGAGVAATASASYWLTFVVSATPDEAPADAMGPKALVYRLFLPTDALYLLDQRFEEAVVRDLFLTDTLPLLSVVALGVIAAAHPVTRRDPLVQTGAALAALLFVALLVHAYLPMRWLGPVSWRHLEWVRLGLALAAVPLLGHLVRRFTHRTAQGIAALGLAALGAWWGRPLAKERPAATEAEWAELRRVWDFVRSHYDPSWGRLYLFDTFGQDWEAGGLARSHVLALTHRETAVPQLGAYYGVVPYRTRWTLSEFNRAFNTRGLNAADMRVLMEKVNSGAALASSSAIADWLERSGEFERIYGNGRFSVFTLKGASSEWIAPLRPSNTVDEVEWRPGHVAFRLRTEQPRARVVLKTTWHPWWRLEGIPDANLIQSPDGFVGITDIPAGMFRVTVRYTPSPWPTWISAAGWAMVAGWSTLLWARRPRAIARA
jgi:hypothetical protein